MKKILFIDTETTGLPKNRNAHYSDVNNWPRMVQIAWILTNNRKETILSKKYLIKPENYIIPNEATLIHKIDTEKARNDGKELIYVLFEFLEDLKKADVLIGHNLNFDEKIIACELFRKNFDIKSLNSIEKICTMNNETIIQFCNLNNKKPTLNELFYKLFKINIENAHDALSDVYATSRCFFELFDRGIIRINENKINISKRKEFDVKEDLKIEKTDKNEKGIEIDNTSPLIEQIKLIKDNILDLKQRYGTPKKVNLRESYEFYENEESYGFSDEIEQSIMEVIEMDREHLRIQDLYYGIDENSNDWTKRYNTLTEFTPDLFFGQKIDKYYLLNFNGETVIDNCFDYFDIIKFDIDDNNVNQQDSSKSKKPIAIVKCQGLYGILNNSLEWLLPCEFQMIANFDNKYFIVLEDSSRNYGLFYIDGFYILPLKYNEIKFLYFEYFAVKSSSYKGLETIAVNCKGEQIITKSYQDIEYLCDNFLKVQQYDRMGAINFEGKQILEFKYENIFCLKKGFLVAKFDRFFEQKKGSTKWYKNSFELSLFDKDFNLKFKFDGEKIVFFELQSQDYFLVTDNDGRLGVVNIFGEVIIPFQFEGIHQFGNGIVKVRDNYGNCGLINYDGSTLITCQYKDIEILSDVNLIKVSKKNDYYSDNKVYGLYDFEYKLILPCKFSKIENFQNGFSIIQKEYGGGAIIDTKGNILVEGLFSTENLEVGDVVFWKREGLQKKVGLIFKDTITIRSDTIGVLKTNGTVEEYTWSLESFKKIFDSRNSKKMVIHILTELKNLVGGHYTFNKWCDSSTTFTKSDLRNMIKLEYDKIDSYIEKIRDGKFANIKSDIF